MTTIPKTRDFELDGNGQAAEWEKADWLTLTPVLPDTEWTTRCRILWSVTGLYFRVECEDRRLTCTLTRDLADLFKEDVVEIFLQPDERHPVYLEYEISPLGYELPLLVSNNCGTFHGWLPWKNGGQRATRRMTTITGGNKIPHAACQAWSTEFFIPFALMTGLSGTPPSAGSKWRANVCRLDYDDGQACHWTLSPATGTNFHDFASFDHWVFSEAYESMVAAPMAS